MFSLDNIPMYNVVNPIPKFHIDFVYNIFVSTAFKIIEKMFIFILSVAKNFLVSFSAIS